MYFYSSWSFYKEMKRLLCGYHKQALKQLDNQLTLFMCFHSDSWLYIATHYTADQDVL